MSKIVRLLVFATEWTAKKNRKGRKGGKVRQAAQQRGIYFEKRVKEKGAKTKRGKAKETRLKIEMQRRWEKTFNKKTSKTFGFKRPEYWISFQARWSDNE